MNNTARDAIRRNLLADRRGLAPDVARADSASAARRASEQIQRLERGGPGVIAGYRALPGEIDPALALDDLANAGWTVVLPVCGAGGRMDFAPWSPGDPLTPSRFGVDEPDAPPVEIATITALIVPGVAFDRRGNRLGHGVGFYDRFFARCAQQSHDPYRLGIAYDFQVVDLPTPEPWDIPMHSVVSPLEVIDTSLCE